MYSGSIFSVAIDLSTAQMTVILQIFYQAQDINLKKTNQWNWLTPPKRFLVKSMNQQLEYSKVQVTSP